MPTIIETTASGPYGQLRDSLPIPRYQAAGRPCPDLPIGPTFAEALATYMPVVALKVTADIVLGDHHLRAGEHIVLSERKRPVPGEIAAVFVEGLGTPYVDVLRLALPPFLKVAPGSDVEPLVSIGSNPDRIFHIRGFVIECVMGVVGIVSPLPAGL